MKRLTPIVATILWSLAIVAIYVFAEYENLSWRLAWGVGLFTIPFVFRLPGRGRSYRYLWPALLLMTILLFIRSSTLFYFAAGLLLLAIWEINLGKKGWLPLFLIATVSPFVGNMAYVWSFPIRLQLSKWATIALSFIGFDVQAVGNVILLDGQEFAVDSACMGLQMLVTSLVLAIFMIARTAYQQQQRHRFTTISFSLSLVLVLAVFANFIRLLALIIFRIPPNNPLHDIVGLISLGVYTLLPFYWGWSYWSNRHFLEKKEPANLPPLLAFWPKGVYVTCSLLLLLFVGLQFRQPVKISTQKLSTFKAPAYQKKIDEYGVMQLTKADALIYVKPPIRAFQGGHDPRICWQGSGYEFTKIDTLQTGEHILYQAILEKENDTLHTAWWYDSQHIKTINEWQWRWATLSQQEQFYLINVTAETKEKLHHLINDWLQMTLP